MMNIDSQLFLYLNNLFSGPVSTLFFSAVTWLGNGWVQAALAVPLMYFLSRDKFRQHLLPMALTAAVGGIFVAAAKEVVDRPRPEIHFAQQKTEIHAPGDTPVDHSFPSGHTQTAFSTATYLSLTYPILSPVFLLAAVLVGFSRIALGVHFPLDVLVGALLGLGFAIAGFKVNKIRLGKKEASGKQKM